MADGGIYGWIVSDAFNPNADGVITEVVAEGGPIGTVSDPVAIFAPRYINLLEGDDIHADIEVPLGGVGRLDARTGDAVHATLVIRLDARAGLVARWTDTGASLATDRLAPIQWRVETVDTLVHADAAGLLRVTLRPGPVSGPASNAGAGWTLLWLRAPLLADLGFPGGTYRVLAASPIRG